MTESEAKAKEENFLKRATRAMEEMHAIAKEVGVETLIVVDVPGDVGRQFNCGAPDCTTEHYSGAIGVHFAKKTQSLALQCLAVLLQSDQGTELLLKLAHTMLTLERLGGVVKGAQVVAMKVSDGEADDTQHGPRRDN